MSASECTGTRSRPRGRGIAILSVLGLCVAHGCSRSGDPTTDPAAGVYVGKVVDSDGRPISGAQVAIDGVAANDLTDASGTFVVSDRQLATTPSAPGVAGAELHEITVLAPGFEPLVGVLDVEAGDVPTLEILRVSLEPRLVVTAPDTGALIGVDPECGEPKVTVEGYVGLVARQNYGLDLVVIVDTSGSAADLAFDVTGDGVPDTILRAEKESLRCFLEQLDLSRTRVSLVRFSDSAEELITASSDLEDLLAVLDAIEQPTGGTNYEAAFRLAEEIFAEQEALDLAEAEADGPPEEGAEPVDPARRRGVVFLSDGIPTTHGVPKVPEDSNLVQSESDRQASIESARSLGEATDAEIYGFLIAPGDDSDVKFTTLSHCVAVSGGGRYARCASAVELDLELCGESLVSAVQVSVVNSTIGAAPVVATIQPGGFFSVAVPVAASADGSARVNELVVTATAFPGELDVSTESLVEVTVIDSSVARSLSFEELLDEGSSGGMVADLPFLSSPTGDPVGGGTALHDFFRSEFEDIVEFPGLEVLSAVDSSGSGAEVVQVTVDVVFKRACWASDFGYLTFDPDDAPRNAAQAMNLVTAEQILLNSGDLGPECNVGSIPAGSRRFVFDVPVGSEVVFFLLPNVTLEEYRSRPNANSSLFTYSRWNPGKADQVLSFRTDDGRTEPGASTVVVAPGRQFVFAFEDISVVKGFSDRDFADLVVSVSASVPWTLGASVCDD